MTFVGMVGMLDPPRAEVFDAIAKCRQAGVRVIVITGDNKETAESICRQIGVFKPNENLKGKSFTGRELDDMSEADKVKAATTASLFSRTEPAHKQELVNILQKHGAIVAMVNLPFSSPSYEWNLLTQPFL
jgi:Ca2+ transporting ATPase